MGIELGHFALILACAIATAAPISTRIITQSTIEPSWLPQTLVILNSSGCSECEFS